MRGVFGGAVGGGEYAGICSSMAVRGTARAIGRWGSVKKKKESGEHKCPVDRTRPR
jgi:hypothetical protein